MYIELGCQQVFHARQQPITMFADATRALKEVVVLEAFTPGIMLTNFILCTL